MAQPTIPKRKPPPMKDWREQVEKRIKQGERDDKDVRETIWLALDMMTEMGPASRWISEQSSYLNSIASEYQRIYVTRFGEQLLPRPQKEAGQEILLNTPEDRKEAIREIALALTKPGQSISDKAILEELKKRSMKLEAQNAAATISTILNGFKSEFEKAINKKGKKEKGLFKRKSQQVEPEVAQLQVGQLNR